MERQILSTLWETAQLNVDVKIKPEFSVEVLFRENVSMNTQARIFPRKFTTTKKFLKYVDLIQIINKSRKDAKNVFQGMTLKVVG